MRRKSIRNILTTLLTMSMLILMCACGSKKNNYSGTWLGYQESVLILNSDGSCKYTQPSWDEAEEGTWNIEDGKLVVKECLGYDIYATLGDSEGALLFESDDSSWNDEVFVLSK